MNTFGTTTPFGPNPIESKDDLKKFLTQLLDALESHTSPGGARVHLGYTGTHYDEAAAQLEGFSRPIWGLASMLAGGYEYKGTRRWVNGLANGTDPDSDEFWGNMRDKDQRMVECSALGFAIAVAREKLWDPLTPEAKEKVANWLNTMNDKEMPNTNWLWFRVFANLGLSKVGSSRFDAKRMKADLDHLDTFYISDGWSRDGPEGVVQLDYYSSSFAIQFAQLAYSKLQQLKTLFDATSIYFHLSLCSSGRAVPFGRSLTYRWAMSSFWGALAFADVDLPAPLTWGVVKGLQLRNIRWWAKQAGAFNSDGTLTIGYVYPNHNMTENYNSPGSPYWCCKSFVTLSLPDSHPFWTSSEESYPAGLLETTKILRHPLHIATNLGGHTYILSSGQQCSYPVKQGAAKYGKFAYSTAFGYSVPVGNGTLEEVGGDNALADTREARFENDKWLRSMWYPWKDVDVETWLVPPTPEAPLWHLRVHRIRSGRQLSSAEGGFAVYGQGKSGRALDPTPGGEEFGTYEKGGEARAASKAGVVGVVDLLGTPSRVGKALRTDANTNLMVPRAVMPTLRAEHDGTGQDVWLVTAVFALPNVEGTEGARAGWLSEWEKPLMK
ncbi:hypothetical protein CPB85DRAFT_1271459 [Mucidula mucida]|nr:hypothetical protein CPB85DRAFT_1271459 [Mucidula mucida]